MSPEVAQQIADILFESNSTDTLVSKDGSIVFSLISKSSDTEFFRERKIYDKRYNVIYKTKFTEDNEGVYRCYFVHSKKQKK